MEGAAERPPSAGDRKKGPKLKVAAIVVVAVLVVAGVLSAVLLMGGQKAIDFKIASSTTVIKAGESVVFDAGNTTDGNGKITRYSWNFGDGTSDEGMRVNHTFPYPGLYSVLLTITGPKGETTGWYESVTITVANPDEPEETTNVTAPYAFIASDAMIITSGTEVTFNATRSKAFGMVRNETAGNWTTADGAEFISALAWDLGDGSSFPDGDFQEMAVMKHTFNGDGKLFPVCVSVTSAGGTVQKYYQDILILPKALAAQTVKNPNIFILAQPDEPQTLDPAYVAETTSGAIIQNVYETLVSYARGSSTELVPVLAEEVPTKENGLVSADGLNYTFNLKSGIKFHDGNTLTARDVQYSFERLLNLNDPSGAARIMGTNLISGYSRSPVSVADIDRAVEVVDDDTVVFHLVDDFAPFIYQMAHVSCSIISSNYVEAHGGIVEMEKNLWMVDHEAGTGPYTLTAWVKSQYVLLQRFDAYHEAPAPMEYVMVKLVQDPNVRQMMLFTGDADCVNVPRDNKQDVTGRPGVRIMDNEPTFELEFLAFNLAINVSDPLNAGMDVPSDFFADRNVRMAFVHAFDYDTFINESLKGTAAQPNGGIPQGMMGHNASVAAYKYDLEQAAAYLRSASNPSHPGQSWADTGFTINLYYHSGYGSREYGAKVLAKGLTALHDEGLIDGTITVNLVATDLLTIILKPIAIKTIGWQPDYMDPNNYAENLFHQDGLVPYYCGVSDAQLTAMVDAAKVEGNSTVRERMYKDMMSYVQEKCYIIWTSQPQNYHVLRDWVTGYQYSPMLSGLDFYALNKG